MKLKYLTRLTGRKIRAATGLPLPICMRAAHFIARCDNYKVTEHPLTSPHVREVPFSCGSECCGTSHRELVGPKGSYGIS
jgi:hypothetical protein